MANKKMISIIIPVHNGKKYIKKTVNALLKQTYANIEIILVENKSADHSYEYCCSLAEKDNRITVLQSNESGTSLARKMGVLCANGDYIVFVDQDDSYIGKESLEKMVNAIISDGTDICQFSYFKEYLPVLRYKNEISDEKIILSANEMLQSELQGVLGVPGSHFDTAVWSKIYQSSILKEAVQHINESLFYAEDEYLNIWAFTSPLVKSVSVRNEAYYCWKTNTGFSSRHNGEALIKDYDVVKPVAIRFANKYFEEDHSIWMIHAESLFCLRAVIFDMIRQKKDKEYILEKINQFNQMTYISEAKQFFRNYSKQSMVWDSLKKLSADLSPEEYYEYCVKELPDMHFKGKIKTFYKKMRKLLKC